MDFTEFFIEATECEKDIKKTLAKLPSKWQKLVAGYKYKFQSGNVLKGDNDHIGVVDSDKKTITIVSPWNYSREYVLLHEIAHQIWTTLNKETKQKWKEIVKSTKMKKKDRQPEEELFSMNLATYYSNNKLSKFNYPKWQEFIKEISS